MNSRRFSQRQFNSQETLRQGICGYFGWSWSAGKDGQILCLNPESPYAYAYDLVPVDLTCPEQGPNSVPASQNHDYRIMGVGRAGLVGAQLTRGSSQKVTKLTKNRALFVAFVGFSEHVVRWAVTVGWSARILGVHGRLSA